MAAPKHAKETTTEIVVVVLAIAFLLWLWLANRNAGAGTGLDSLPVFGGGSDAGTAPAPSTFAVGPATPGFTATANPPAGTGAACNSCASTAQGVGPQFGSLADLIAYLQTVDAPQLAADGAALTSNEGWY